MCEAVVSCCDPAEVLEASDHALDGVAIAVEVGREAILPAVVCLMRDVGCGALLTILWRTASLSYPLSPCRISAVERRSSRASAAMHVGRRSAGRCQSVKMFICIKI